MLSCLLPTEQVAAIAAPASYPLYLPSHFIFRTLIICIYSIFILFAGFIIPPPLIPDWWIWLYYLSPFHYALEGLMINELSEMSFTCTPPELYPLPSRPLSSLLPCPSYLEYTKDIHHTITPSPMSATQWAIPEGPSAP